MLRNLLTNLLAVPVPVVNVGLEPPAAVTVPGAIPLTAISMSTSDLLWASYPAKASNL